MTPERLVPRVVAGLMAASLLIGAVGGGMTRVAAAARAGAAPAPVPDRVYRIMPLGDSITRGLGQLSASGRYAGWRVPLRRHLDDGAVPAGFRYAFVGSVHDQGAGDGEGHGGWTIDEIAARADDWLATYRPDVVLLHLGTNNVSRGEPAQFIAAALARLIARIVADLPQVQLFVAKIIGTNGAGLVERRVHDEYAAAIPGVVAAAGPRVHLVDQSSVRGPDIYDQHHPNARGYAKMAFNWYEALRAVLGPRWLPVADPYQSDWAHVCHWDYRSRRPACSWTAVTHRSPERTPGAWPPIKNQENADGIEPVASAERMMRTVATGTHIFSLIPSD